MNQQLREPALENVNGGNAIDPISGYDYENILDKVAMLCGDWVYEEFQYRGAAGLKKRMLEEFGDLWFVKKFPVYDKDGNVIG